MILNKKLRANLKVNLWEKLPEETTLAECRAFAGEHNLSLPAGVSQSKAAYVALFMCCHFTPERFVSMKRLGLSQADRRKLYGYAGERDLVCARKNGKGKVGKTSGSKKPVVAEPNRAVVEAPPVPKQRPERARVVRHGDSHAEMVEVLSSKGRKQSSHRPTAASCKKVVGQKRSDANQQRGKNHCSRKFSRPPAKFTPEGQRVRAPQLGHRFR